MAESLVVVTGAGGFVGTALVAHFRDRGRAFVAATRQGAPFESNQARMIGDLAQASDAELDALLAGATAVVHLAGRAHVTDETAPDPEAAYRLANVEATARLARAAARSGVSRFVLASTVKVNGESTRGGQPFLPGDAPDPHDAYARSKLAAEGALLEAAQRSSMATVVLRLPLLYGPGVKGNFARLVRAVVAGRLLPVGAIRNRRNLLYVGNLVGAVDAALDAVTPPSGVHFVADGEAVSTPALVRAIALAWKVQPRIVSVPVPFLRPVGAALGKGTAVARLVQSLEIDTSSFREATGWEPRWSLSAALEQTAAAMPGGGERGAAVRSL